MLSNCGAEEDSWESLRWQGDQSILKEINPEYSLEGLMLKLKLQYFGHLMWRVDSLEKTLMLGEVEGSRRRAQDGWMASPAQWTWVWTNSKKWLRTGKPDVLWSMGLQIVIYDWVTEKQENTLGFPGGTRGKEPTCQCRRCKWHEFNPWVEEIPWRRAWWQPTPVFFPGEPHGQRSLAGCSS